VSMARLAYPCITDKSESDVLERQKQNKMNLSVFVENLIIVCLGVN